MIFAVPAVLFAFLALPAIWWLLRLTPPRPRAEVFPPARIVAEVVEREQTSSQTPWWLTALRFALAAIIILALAGPSLRGTVGAAPGDGPLLLVVDNGWASARNWTATREAALAIVRAAEEAERPVGLVATAEAPRAMISPTDPAGIADRLTTIEPQPFAARYADLEPQLRTIAGTAAFGGVAWFSDGLGGPEAEAFAAFLDEIVAGPVTIYTADAPLLGLTPPANGPDGLTVPVLRRDAADPTEGVVVARDLRGRAIGETAFTFGDGAVRTDAVFNLPPELRNEVARLEIGGQPTAGAIQLLDDRYRRRTVGIVAGDAGDQPLLSAEYYLSRALMPFADVRMAGGDIGAALSGMIGSGLPVIILADIGTLAPEVEAELAAWVANGGTLVRFAGPRLAASEPTLIPVALRAGGRILGGALSWDVPQPLGPFPPASPFFGLDMPADVLVERQVLAEPNAALTERIWAVLADGTPLVTGGAEGRGLVVLFHVTADTSWSNLPLSGVFVEMLRRIVERAGAPAGAGEAAETALLPYRMLDGFGRFVDPGPDAEPIPAGATAVAVNAAHPPGLYGTDEGFRALSLLAANAALLRLEPAAGATLSPYPAETPSDLAPWLFAAALALLLLDTLAVLWLSGSFAPRGQRMAVLVLAAALLPAVADDAEAQTLTAADLLALEAVNRPALAYVVTGDPLNDRISEAGLTGLSWILTLRTSFEPGDPIGVDIATDELSFFPLLYWRITPEQPMPSAEAMVRLGAYMRNGGIVLFDTADQLQRTTADFLQATTAAGERLQDMLAGLDIPPLEPAPIDHVVNKTYYLLDDFPGRYTGGELWVEVLPPVALDAIDRPARPTDGVSPIIITSNDLAAAWAIETTGAYMFPVATNDPRQREFAYRAGVNIVMYALTGNYKTDQIHVPDLLERLRR